MRHILRTALIGSVLSLALSSPALGCERFEALDDFAHTSEAPRGATCQVYRGQSGSAGVSCHWSFPFRNGEAESLAAELWAALTACRPGTQAGPDLKVNHPDSYDLLEWESASHTYRVSVKDKGALQETLVFLRRE